MSKANWAMITPDVNGFDTEGRVRVLKVIDKLRELGIGDSVSLPQLVVVGDQSSGKSSLLEGLTGISFPIASDLCTRFAMQIVLRRTPANEAEVRITIIPGPTAQTYDKAKEHLLDFEQKISTNTFGSKEFLKLFHEAAKCMGVPGPNTIDLESLEKRFSDDILKIELSGPEHRNLSIVDTDEDREIIRKLIETYLTDKRTIILAVMDARNNLANQEVFSMARAADRAGSRTVGIITKCDASRTGMRLEKVLKIARNEVEKLTHGWFAVRNRSTQEIKEGITIEGRHKKEKEFFSTVSPWTSLKKDRVGIQALKVFLGQLLYTHIRSEYPGVVKDIENILQGIQGELEQLGPSRQTTSDQRRCLTRIAANYRQDVLSALSGNYKPGIEAKSPLKLRMHIRDLNDRFALAMAHSGHTTKFKTVDGSIDKEYERPSGNNQDIYECIRAIYRDSRGAELPGTVNPTVLENMFRQQSMAWESIAIVYMEKVSSAVREFNELILADSINDETLRENLKAKFQQHDVETSCPAEEELSKILRDERGGILQTVNHYFADNLSNIRQERIIARLKAGGLRDGHLLNLQQVAKGVHLSNEDQAVYDIHDILKAYYKVALKRFTDNVVIHIAERHLLGASGPVKTFSPEYVSDFDDSELEQIAGESYATSSIRNELTSKVERLKRALEIAKKANM